MTVSQPSAAAPELKMWLAVRTDVPMPRGKLATQAGHGFCGALVAALVEQPERARVYLAGATAKITVAARNPEVLERIHAEAIAAGIPACLVRDAGRTVFAEPTLTVCAFGPCLRTDLPPYLARLQLLKDGPEL